MLGWGTTCAELPSEGLRLNIRNRTGARRDDSHPPPVTIFFLLLGWEILVWLIPLICWDYWTNYRIFHEIFNGGGAYPSVETKTFCTFQPWQRYVCYQWTALRAAAEGYDWYPPMDIMILTMTMQDYHMRKRRPTNPTSETLKPGYVLYFFTAKIIKIIIWLSQ